MPKQGDFTMKPALLVIDIQNKWLSQSPGLRASVELRVDVINSAIALFRKTGHPIIVVHHVDKEEGPDPGTEDFEFLPSISVDAGDVRVVKNYPNAFNKTDLESLLRRMQVDTVILSGLSATACVMATYIGAEDRDLHVYLLRDGVAAGNEQNVRFAEEIFDTMSLSALRQISL
jgi:nicotinamidase-related amidase